ncbi:MAG: TOBE domain-containing protein, partial [SAR324 cluster bacterium]|nr:TOBE domain-containing protein [SAR324 cluster bacterium]
MKIKKVVCYFSVVVLIVALSACDNDQQAAAPASAPTDQAVVQNSNALRGKVTATHEAGGYTYIRIDNGSEEGLWAAIPKSELKLGETVTLQGGTVMKNFSSKTLNRTFESIIFAGGVMRDDGSQPAAPKPVAASASGGKAGNVVAFEKLKIEKARAANA